MAGGQDFRLRELWRARRGKWLLAWLLGAAALLAAVALLAVSGWFISAAALAGLLSLASAYTFDYFRPAAVIRALAVIRTAGRYGERLASHDAVLALLSDLRCRFFGRLAQSSEKGTASARAMHRLTGDIDLLDHLPLRFFMPWLWALLLQTAFLLWLLLRAPVLAGYAFLPLLFAGVLLPALAAWRGGVLARQDADAAETRRTLLLEPLRILTALLLWQRWADCRAAFLAADDAYGAAKRRQQFLASVYAWWQQCALALLAGVLVWQAWPLLEDGTLGVAGLLAMVLAVFGLSEVLQPLAAQFMALGFALAARDRLNALPYAMPSERFQTASEGAALLVAEQLSARQPGALNGAAGVSFSLPRGGALVIRGRSGCGKSTLLDALAGELPLLAGRLKWDGRPYHAGEANYLAQQVDIFDSTLAENLRLGDEDIGDGQLWQVLEKTALAGWARAQPQGLNTPLGEYGAAVSGGQARRIALARLLLRPKPLLLLDEPFAGLDETTRNRLWQMLRQEQKNGWLVVVSHQLPEDDGAGVLDL